MTIKEYINLIETSNDVYKDMDNALCGYDMEKYGDNDALYTDALKVIRSFQEFLDNIMKKANLEDMFK